MGGLGSRPGWHGLPCSWQLRPAQAFSRSPCRNLATCPTSPQTLSSGKYTLQDIRCRACLATLGWTYLEVHSGENQYKRGTFLISEAALVHRAASGALAAASPLSDSSSGDELPGSSSYRSSRPRSAGLAPLPGLAAGYMRGLRRSTQQQRQAA